MSTNIHDFHNAGIVLFLEVQKLQKSGIFLLPEIWDYRNSRKMEVLEIKK